VHKENVDPVTKVSFVLKPVERDCRNWLVVVLSIKVVECRNETSKGVNFAFGPRRLRYMLAELFRNSCQGIVNK